MKALITRTALMIATTVASLSTFAGEPSRPANSPAASLASFDRSMERELDHQINRFVTYPILDRGHNMNGEVLVSFVIDIQGKVKVISANSDNPELCEYVLRKLAKVDIGDNPNGVWRTTHMRFVFHPEV